MNSVSTTDLHQRVLSLEARHDRWPLGGEPIVPHDKPLFEDRAEDFEKLKRRRLGDDDET